MDGAPGRSRTHGALLVGVPAGSAHTAVHTAVHNSEICDDAERLRALESRTREAEDLLDDVMQRLFAIGLGLHSLARADLPADAGERLSGYVEEMDQTIDEVRERIFRRHGSS